MGQATPSWTFDASAGSWTSYSDSGLMVASYDGSNGSPSAGCLQMDINGKNKSAIGYWHLTGITWEDLGVPAGATVTSVQGSYYWRCSVYTTGASSGDGPLEIDTPDGLTVIASMVSEQFFTATSSWAQRSGSDQSIGASYQASNTSIDLRVNCNLATGNSNSAEVTWQIDTVALVITYSTEATGTFNVTGADGTISSGTGTVDVEGTSSVTGSDGTVAGSGTVDVSGSASLTGAAGTLAGTGTVASATTLLTDLVGHWKLNESSGTRYDSHGSLDLTDLNSDVASTTGKLFGDAARFINTDQGLYSASGNALGFSTDQDYTVAFWVKPLNGGDYDTFICYGANNADVVIRLRLWSGNYQLLHDGGTTLDGSAFTNGTWAFVVARYDSANDLVRLRVNGTDATPVSYSGGTSSVDSNYYLLFGAYPLNSTYPPTAFQSFAYADLDSVSIWTRHLSDAELDQLYNSGNGIDYESFEGGVTGGANLTGNDGTVSSLGVIGDQYLLDDLKAHWKLNETSGDRYDSHSNGLDVTENGAGTVGYTTGVLGNAALFDPVSGNTLLYRAVASCGSLQMGIDTPVTIAAWVRIDGDTPDGTGGIIGFGATGDGWALAHRTGTSAVRLYWQGQSGGTTLEIAEPTQGEWALILAWHDPDANTLNISVNNGTPQSTAWTDGSDSSVSTNLTFGGFAGSTAYLLDGAIDSASVWHKVLTSAERGLLYNGGRGLDYDSFASAPTGVSGTANLTGDDGTVSGTGTVDVEGTASFTGDAGTLAGTTSVEIQGTASLTGDSGTVAGTGEVIAGITGTLDVTGDDGAVSANGVVDVQGTASISADLSTLSATGSAEVQGDASLTADDGTLAGTGNVVAGISGTFNITGDNGSLTSSVTVEVSGSAAITAEAGLLASAAALQISASASLTGADGTLFGEGTIGAVIHGTADLHGADGALVSSGSVSIDASGTITGESGTLSGQGSAAISASLSTSGEPGSLAGSVTVLVQGTSTVQLDSGTISGNGVVGSAPITGTFNVTGGDGSIAATGTVLVSAQATLTDAGGGLTSSGEVSIEGQSTVQLQAGSLTATAANPIAGSADLTGADGTVDGTGVSGFQPVICTFDVTGEDGSVGASAIVLVTGASTLTLDPGTLSAGGAVEVTGVSVVQLEDGTLSAAAHVPGGGDMEAGESAQSNLSATLCTGTFAATVTTDSINAETETAGTFAATATTDSLAATNETTQ